MKSLYPLVSRVQNVSNVKLSESLAPNRTENLLKKFILRTAGVVALFLFLGGSVWGQCTNTFTTQLPAATQTPGTSFTTNTGKYFAINVVSGTVYKITSSLGGSAFNIRMGSATGAVVWTGVSGSDFTAPSTGVAYVHHSTSACATGTNTTNRTITFVGQSCNTNYTSPWIESFEGLAGVPSSNTGNAVLPCGWSITHGNWATVNAAFTTYNDPRTGSNYLVDSWSAVNEIVFTKGFNLTAGTTYDFQFFYSGDGFSTWSGAVVTNTQQTVAGSTELGTPFIASGTATVANAYTSVSRLFTPSVSGVYYFGVRINESTGGPWYFGLDDFSLTTSAPCSGTPSPGSTVASSASVATGSTVNLSLQNATSGTGVTYQWESSTTSSSSGYSNISGATSSTYTATVTANTWYRCKVTCSGNTGTSTATQVVLAYCTPVQTGSSAITNVTLDAINNTTGSASPFYSQQTPTTSLLQGFSYPLTVTTDISSIVSVWIDWNKNLLFETTEWAQVYTTGTTGTITINVPANALTGSTTMRIRSRNSGSPNASGDPCTGFGSGETEDYLVTIAAPIACSGTTSPGDAFTWSPALVTGYNADIIANGIGNASASATQADVAGYGFVSADFKATAASAAPTYALPVSGIVNSAANAGVKYQMASSNVNNALRLVSGSTSGTVTLSNATSARRIGLLVTSGSGTSTFSAQVNFSDGTNETFSNIAVADWYGSGYAIAGIGRVVLSTNVLEGSATQPGLYDALITLSASNYSKTISSILITKTDAVASSLIVMGVSLYTSTTSQVVCNGQSRVLSIPAAPTGVTGLTYQWQSSTDNSTWANIASATSTTYTTPALTTAGNIYYRCGVTCSGSTGYSSSTLLTVNGTASVSAGTLCSGGTAVATALPATNSTYFWSSSLGTNQTATISAAGTYTVNVNNNGCISANNVTLTTAPINTAGAGSSAPTICVNSSLTAITHSTTGATGIGTATGLPSGVTATWASNTITISGTATEVGTFNYSIPLTGGCGTVNATGTITVSGVSCASSLLPADNATNQSANGIVLSWASVPCATGYDVYLNDVLVSENQAGIAYTTGSLTASSNYTWKVVPRNGSVFASACSTLNFATSAACTPPTFTVESVNVSCYGQLTGSITISASGGQSPLSYSIDGGNTYSSSDVFTSLPAGIYSVVVKGSDDCLAAAQAVTISQPAAALSVSASGSGSGCGGSTLSLSSNVTGGTSPYTYSWTNATGLSSGTVANPTATIGSFDSHTLSIQDANGCTATSSAVTITNNSPAAPTVVTPAAICQGQSANLNATSSGNSINWYTVSSGGTAIASLVNSGANYSVSPLTTATYFAEAVIATPGSQSFSYTGSIVNWTVPAGVTSISVDAKGAQGGSQPEFGINYGGRGARIVANNITVTPGQTLKILVGQAGTNGSSDDGCGGGGGTYLTTSSNTPLVIAGGGGGDGADQQGINASLTTTSTANGDASRAGSAGPNGGLANDGSGGGGLSGNGANGATTTSGGLAFTNGGTGGVGLRNGGFGGGGAGGTSTEGAGGGGGYAGGPGGSSGTDAGGGGSSYSLVTPATATATQTGNGSLLITYTSVGCASTRTPVTVNVNEAPTATAGAALSAICQGQTSAAMGGSIGGTATSGTWSGGAGTWTNANNPATATYTAGSSESGTITLTLTPSGGSCPAVAATKTIVVNANPSAPTSPVNLAICQNGSGNISVNGTLTGTQNVIFNITAEPIETQLTPGNTVASASISALPVGTTITSAALTINNLTALGLSWMSDVRLGLSGAVVYSAILGNTTNGAGVFNYSSNVTSGFTVNTASTTLNLLYADAGNDNVGAECTFGVPKAANLTLNYTFPVTINWYNAATGGSLLGSGATFNPIGTSVLPNTSTPGVYNFYAAAVSSAGCEGARTLVTVTVTAAPNAGTISGTETICSNGTTTFTTDGNTGGTWTSGTQSVATINASTGVIAPVSAGTSTMTYTVTGTGGCSNATATRTVTVNAVPSTPTVTVTDNCNGTSTLSTTATGTLLWSTTETTSPITVSTADTYTVTQTVNGCTSASGSAVAAPKTTPVTPSVSVTNDCGLSTLVFTPAANATILWSNNATTASTTTSSNTTLTVVQTVNGCPSSAGSGSAVPLVIPSAPVADAAQNFCVTDNATVASLAYTNVAGNTYTWYDAATAGNTVATSTQLPTATTSYYLSVSGSNGCTSLTRTLVAATESAQALATVSITGTSTCPGGEITFTATPSNGGNSPTYQWYNGGVPILNATGNTYIATGLAEGAVITVKMIPSGSCVTVCPN